MACSDKVTIVDGDLRGRNIYKHHPNHLSMFEFNAWTLCPKENPPNVLMIGSVMANK